MTNAKIYEIALKQSATDLGAEPLDFLKGSPVVVRSVDHPRARKYLKLPFSLQLVSYGNNAVASVSDGFYDIAREYIEKYPVEHLFETPNMQVLNDRLLAMGQRICFMAE